MSSGLGLPQTLGCLRGGFNQQLFKVVLARWNIHPDGIEEGRSLTKYWSWILAAWVAAPRKLARSTRASFDGRPSSQAQPALSRPIVVGSRAMPPSFACMHRYATACVYR